jgi:hypothetical protein
MLNGVPTLQGNMIRIEKFLTYSANICHNLGWNAEINHK